MVCWPSAPPKAAFFPSAEKTRPPRPKMSHSKVPAPGCQPVRSNCSPWRRVSWRLACCKSSQV